MDDCVFCKIVDGTLPAECVYEDEHALAFMDINPATDGHLLVIPKRHARDLLEIDEVEARHVMAATHRVAQMVSSALQPDGINLIQANGAAAFQTVFHLHVHVVPRYRNDGIVLPWTPTPGDPEQIAEVAEKVRSAALL